MRNLKRNKKPFYYSLYTGKEMILDEQGYKTGEYRNTYSTPVEIYGHISTTSGEAQAEQFGTQLNYDNVILVDDMTIPIDENSVLWIDIDTSEPFNYIVKKVAKSFNCISYAISKVEKVDSQN